MPIPNIENNITLINLALEKSLFFNANLNVDTDPATNFRNHMALKELPNGKFEFYVSTNKSGTWQWEVVSDSSELGGFNIKDPVLLATATSDTVHRVVPGYDSSLSGFTDIGEWIFDGFSGNTLPVDTRILVKDQPNEIENGIYIISEDGGQFDLLRAPDSDGSLPDGIVSVNDYVFVESGSCAANIASSWVLSETDALDQQNILVGVETQVWKIFSRSAAYTAGTGLELQGQEFNVLFDDETIDLNIEGELQVSSSVINQISTNQSDIATLTGQTESLETAIDSNATEILILTGQTDSLSTAVSQEILDRISGDTSLEDALTELSGATLDIEDILSDDELLGMVNGELTGVTNIQSQLSTDIETLSGLTSTLSSGLTSLESTVSNNIEDIVSIETAINNLSGVTEVTAGSGLTYDSSTQSLNVNVDGVTIKISGDTLIGPREWMQDTNQVNISGTSGSTGLELDHDPITPVNVYVNGINYFVNPDTNPSTNRPFFYDQFPPQQGTEIWFDPSTAGFDIEENVDTIAIKYLITEDFILNN